MKRFICMSFSAALAVGCGRTEGPVAERPVEAAVVSALSYITTDLGTLPGGSSSGASDINDAGVVVGTADNAAGQSRAFRWTSSEGMTDLGTLPGGSQSNAIRIANSGRILGLSDRADGTWVPVIWSAGGRMTQVNIPRLPRRADYYLWSLADGNERGEFVGYTYDGVVEHGWFWSKAGGLVDLRTQFPTIGNNQSATAINARGVVTGGSSLLDPGHLVSPFVWKLGRGYKSLGDGPDSLNPMSSAGTAINDSGDVVGYLENLPFLWSREAGMAVLPNLPGSLYSLANPNGLNASRVVVGSSYDYIADFFRPVVWPTSTTIVPLDGPVPQPGGASAVNAQGQIVGVLQDNTGANRAQLWDPSGAQAHAGVSVAARSGSAPTPIRRGAPSRLASCLSDPKVMRSRTALTLCVMQN